MALGPSNVFGSFVCNKYFELFEHFGEGRVGNFEVVCHSYVNLRELSEALNA